MATNEPMERTQISLERSQARRLRELAVERHVSMSHLIRDAVVRTYGTEDSDSHEQRWQRLLSAAGVGHGGGANSAEEHDLYLEDIYSS